MLPNLTVADCNNILTNRSKTRKQKCARFELNRISAEVLGFLGAHFLLTIHQDQTISIRHHFFVKTLPNLTSKHLEYVKKLNVFEKEVLLYKNLLPEFQTYFTQKFLPDCYLVKSSESVIVLEDLSLQGYGIKDNFLNYPECECLIKAMAKLHVASIVFEEKRSTPDYLYRINEHYPAEIKETTFVFSEEDHPRKRWLSTGINAIVECAKLMPEYANNFELQEKLLNFAKDGLAGYVKPSKKFRNTVSHADLWKNNALFKTNRSDELECVLIDFQLARYAPPAFDILTSLYLNVPSDFLAQNMSKLLSAYYDEFRKNLNLHRIDPDTIMTIHEFLDSIELYKLPSLLEASLFATLIFAGNHVTNALMTDDFVFEDFMLNNRSKYVRKEFGENKLFRDRCSDIFENLLNAIKNTGF